MYIVVDVHSTLYLVHMYKVHSTCMCTYLPTDPRRRPLESRERLLSCDSTWRVESYIHICISYILCTMSYLPYSREYVVLDGVLGGRSAPHRLPGARPLVSRGTGGSAHFDGRRGCQLKRRLRHRWDALEVTWQHAANRRVPTT